MKNTLSYLGLLLLIAVGSVASIINPCTICNDISYQTNCVYAVFTNTMDTVCGATCSAINWNLEPPDAGTISPNGCSVIFYPSNTFCGNGIVIARCSGSSSSRSATNVVINANISIDSNNNGDGYGDLFGVEQYPDEEPWEEQDPGKILTINREDINTNRVPDFADGIVDGSGNTLYSGSSTDVPNLRFYQLPLRVCGLDDISKVKVRLIYSASTPVISSSGMTITHGTSGTLCDPQVITNFFPASGAIRIWTKDGDQTRTNKSVQAGGDFIPSDVDIDLTNLTHDASINEVTLYIEGIAPINSQKIVLKAFWNNCSSCVCTDSVKYSVVELDADLKRRFSSTADPYGELEESVEFSPGLVYQLHGLGRKEKVGKYIVRKPEPVSPPQWRELRSG